MTLRFHGTAERAERAERASLRRRALARWENEGGAWLGHAGAAASARGPDPGPTAPPDAPPAADPVDGASREGSASTRAGSVR